MNPSLLFHLRIAAAGALLVLSGCGSECRHVCDRIHECVDSSSDVEACTRSCEQKNDDNKDHASRVHDCSTCISGKSCSEAVNRCFSLCVGL